MGNLPAFGGGCRNFGGGLLTASFFVPGWGLSNELCVRFALMGRSGTPLDDLGVKRALELS
jgi:hypothetical protein